MAQRGNPSNTGQGYAGAPPVYGSGQGYDSPPTKYNNPGLGNAGPPSIFYASGQQCNSSQYYSQPRNDIPATRQQCIESQYQCQPRNDFSVTRQQCAGSQYYSQSRNDFPITSLPSPQPQPVIRSQTDYCQPQTMPSQQICRQSPGYIDQTGYSPHCAQQTLGQPGEQSLYSSSPTRGAAPRATKNMYFNTNVMNYSSGSGNNYQSVVVRNHQEENITEAAPSPPARDGDGNPYIHRTPF